MTRLNIIAVEQNKRPRTKREELQTKFDTLWEQDPYQFHSLRNAREKERIRRTMGLIEEHIALNDKRVADLGCGDGELSRLLRDAGASVHAVDISQRALRKFKERDSQNIRLIQDCAPSTRLEDNAYDIILCTELIAHLQEREYRLLISELARLVNRDGWVVISTPIDIYSEDALERFISLVETELDIIHWKLSYHRMHIRLQDFFYAPENRTLLLLLEKISYVIWGEAAVSHVIVFGQRRPLF